MTRSLSTTQWTFCIGFGFALWLSAIFLVRVMASLDALSGIGLIISFIVPIPGTIPAVLLTARVMGPSKGRMLIGVAIVSAIALMLAGISFGFFPGIYGSNPAVIVSAAGFILWVGGIGLVLGLILGKDA